MSTRVMVICEDFRQDQYILKPLIQALFESLERPTAKILMCRDPLLMGVAQATDKDRLAEVLTRYQGMIDLFLLCVDRDGNPTRKHALAACERWAAESHTSTLIAENAWQELEVWVLAGHDLPPEWEWHAIRQERDPKETYFLPFAAQQGSTEGPDEGRKALAEAAARRYPRIRQLCPEDIQVLESRIADWFATR